MSTNEIDNLVSEWDLVNLSPTNVGSRTLPIFDKLLDVAEYKDFIQYAYFCTWEPEGRDKCFMRIFQEYSDPKDYIEVDPSSLPDFGRRNVFIMIPNLLRTTAPPNDSTTDDTYDVEDGEDGQDRFYGSLLYLFAYDPAVVEEEAYAVNERYQFEGLEDIIVGYSPYVGITEDFYLGFANDLKWSYDYSSDDCWKREYEVDGERRERVVTQVLAHLREKHGDLANKEEFWRNWFSFAEGSERLERFLTAGTFRTDPPWQEQNGGDGGADHALTPPGDISMMAADEIEAGLAQQSASARVVALTHEECLRSTSKAERRRRREAREAQEAQGREA